MCVCVCLLCCVLPVAQGSLYLQVEEDEMEEEEERPQRDVSGEEEEDDAEEVNSEADEEEAAALADSDENVWNSDKSDTYDMFCHTRARLDKVLKIVFAHIFCTEDV